MTARRTRDLALSGLAARHRRGAARTSLTVLSLAGATLALSGCTAPDEGVVLTGADGEKYVVPDGAERPEYRSREDCIADVTEQIRQLEAQGEDIVDEPEDLCESTERYHGAYVHPWIGPILFAGARWNSSRVAGWSPVANGGFAAPGGYVQKDVVSPAPAGSKVGSAPRSRAGSARAARAASGRARAADAQDEYVPARSVRRNVHVRPERTGQSRPVMPEVDAITSPSFLPSAS
ncbi:hypothetical protein [Naasia aerilata]|uniref:Uncharacterized protein n=1 Tax=Naasia aerilata TaxID=1162966 RepID=A0ABN6XNR0_9MICO|nr:hypothetical protein [Naasia aerilata]BDZ45301.1 hypothetical protein GCM10025866_12100 [Naasia aerilata]